MPGDKPINADKEKSEAFRWRVRPSDKAPQRVAVIVAVAVLAFLAGTIVFRNLYLGVVGFAIIFGSTAEFWLGTSFSVDEERATVRTGLSVTAIAWSDVKRVIKDSGGIKLSPLAKSGTMDAFRGVYLRYGDNNRECIEGAVLKFAKFSDNDVVGRPDGRGDGSPDPEGGE